MSKYFQLLSKNFALLTLLFVSIFGFTSTNLNVQALTGQDGIGINPTDSDAAEKFTKGWFVEKLNPGDQVERSVTVSNYSNDEKKVILQGEDYAVADQGSFSFSDKEELKAVGKWIQIDGAPITVPAQKAVNIKFKVTVPKDAKPGEYAGVLVVQEAPKDNKSSGFSVVSRLGARIYITVPGNLETGFKFNSFKFITPSSSYTTEAFYKDFLSANFGSPFNSVFLSLDFKNVGNVFAKLKGKVEVTDPSGKTSSTNFDRDYAAFDPNIAVKYFLVNDVKWTPGKFKAKFTFENPAVIQSNKGDVKNVSPTQVVETEFDITQAQVDQLKADFAKAGENKNAPKVETKKETSDEGLVIKQADAEKKDESKKDYAPYFVGGAVAVVLVGVAGVVAFFITKKKKSEKLEEVKSESKTKVK